MNFVKWEGTDYVPPLTHPALEWSVKDPAPPSRCNRCTLQIIDKKKKKEIGNETAHEVKTTNIQDDFVAAKDSVPLKSGKK